jgi:hypothetical protein
VVLWKCLVKGSASVATVSPSDKALEAKYAPGECR